MGMISREDFCDEESRMIFDKRKAFYETGDWNHLLECVAKTYDSIRSKAVKSLLCELDQFDEIAIFGAGKLGTRTYELISTVFAEKLAGFIDNNSSKKSCCNLPVFSVLDFCRKYSASKKPACVVIPEGGFADEMYGQLLEHNYPERYILRTLLCHTLPPAQLLRSGRSPEKKNILLNKENKFVLWGNVCDYGTPQLIFNILTRAGRQVSGFCDSYDKGSPDLQFRGVPSISAREIEEKYWDCYVICDYGAFPILLHMLPNIDLDRVILLFYITDWQYFDQEIVPETKDTPQIFVDAGCFDLGTSLDFVRWSGKNFKRIYAFEPEQDNYICCKKRLAATPEMKLKDIRLHNKGLWSEEGTASFVSVCGPNIMSSASFVEGRAPMTVGEYQNMREALEIDCCTIDETVGEDPVTFIKMDIEGSELEALKGAKRTIVRNHPILAISIYHKPEDIIEIPSYIKEIAPGYKFYLRCYHPNQTEQVLYAFWDD